MGRSLHSLYFLANSAGKEIEQLMKGNTVIYTILYFWEEGATLKTLSQILFTQYKPQGKQWKRMSEWRECCSTPVFHGDGTTAKLQLQRTNTWSRPLKRAGPPPISAEIPARKVIRPGRSITVSKQNAYPRSGQKHK